MVYTLLVISLGLIVLGTIPTLGSPIKDDYSEERSKGYPNGKDIVALLSDAGLGKYPEMFPNRKELEDMLLRSNPATERDTNKSPKTQVQTDLLLLTIDQDNKKSKRVDPGTVIAGAELGFTVLKSVLDALMNVHRKVAIGIDNESGHKWTANNVYFYSGTSDVVMPHTVNTDSGEALLYGARKTSVLARGAIGTMTYYIPDISQTLVVMFSVPFDYNLYSNWWDVKLYSGYRSSSYSNWRDMYYGNPFKGDNHGHYRDLGSGLKFKGAMSSSSTATLEIHVEKK